MAKKQGRNKVRVYWISTKQPEMVRANLVQVLGAKRTRGGQSTTIIGAKKKKSKRDSESVSTSNNKKPRVYPDYALAMPFEELVLKQENFVKVEGEKVIFKIVGNKLHVDKEGALVGPVNASTTDM